MAIAEVTARFTADTSGLATSLAKAEASIKATGQRMQELGTTAGTVFGAIGGAVTVGLGAAVKKSMDFGAQMSKVGAIAGATGDDLERLRQTALDLGASTSLSAVEVAQGMELMAAAGFEVNEIIGAMPGVIAAAEASGEDLAIVSDVVAAALNGFGLEAAEAARVADIMAMAANRSAASVNDFGYAFKYAAPLAKQLGIEIEDLSAMVMVMADAGIEGSQAGTTLRMTMQRLANPPKKARDAIQALGVSLTDANGKMRPTKDILADIIVAMQDLDGDTRTAAASAIFGTEAMSGMLNVIEAGPDKLEELATALRNSEGAAKEAADKMKDNLAGAIEELSGAFETAQITIGDALTPVIRAVAEAITQIINAFNALPGPIQTFIAGFTAIIGILSLVASAVGFAVAGLGALSATLGVTIGTLLSVAGIAVAVVAGIFALGAAIVYAYNKFEWFRNLVNQAWNAIKAGFQAVVDFLKPAVQAVVDFVLQQWEKIKAWWGQSGPTIIQAVQNVWTVLSTIISTAANIIWSIMQFVWPAIKVLIVSTWENIKGVISAAIDIILSIIDIFANLLTGNWKGLWNSIVKLLEAAWQLIWNLVQLWAVGKIVKLFSIFGSKSFSLIKSAWDKISSATSSFLSKIWNLVSSKFSSITSTISSAINKVKSTISNGFNTAVSYVSNAVSKIKSYLSGLASQALSWGKNLISMFAKGITSKIGAVISAAKNVAAKVKSYLGFSSPTEEGPASNSDHWAPNFMKMFSQGLERNIPLVARAVRLAAAELAALNTLSANPTINPGYVGTASTGIVPQDVSPAGSILITGNTFYVRKDSDIREIARELYNLQQKQLRARGRVR